jgi:CMP-N-acetylneuraminic acid synthetase
MTVAGSKYIFHSLRAVPVSLIFAHSIYVVFQSLPTDLSTNSFCYIIDNNVLKQAMSIFLEEETQIYMTQKITL